MGVNLYSNGWGAWPLASKVYCVKILSQWAYLQNEGGRVPLSLRIDAHGLNVPLAFWTTPQGVDVEKVNATCKILAMDILRVNQLHSSESQEAPWKRYRHLVTGLLLFWFCSRDRLVVLAKVFPASSGCLKKRLSLFMVYLHVVLTPLKCCNVSNVSFL